MTFQSSTRARRKRIDFEAINRTALSHFPTLLRRWLPAGQFIGDEFVSRNPLRCDNRAGSFRINARNGRWADFATHDSGGDVISLTAYLFRLSQVQAAEYLAEMLGMEAYNDAA